jgi:hypothetical protein
MWRLGESLAANRQLELGPEQGPEQGPVLAYGAGYSFWLQRAEPSQQRAPERADLAAVSAWDKS